MRFRMANVSIFLQNVNKVRDRRRWAKRSERLFAPLELLHGALEYAVQALHLSTWPVFLLSRKMGCREGIRTKSKL